MCLEDIDLCEKGEMKSEIEIYETKNRSKKRKYGLEVSQNWLLKMLAVTDKLKVIVSDKKWIAY